MKKFTSLSNINEANETPCQTNGAIYSININDDKINISVDLPFKLDISEDEATILENNLHNVIEIVLSKYF